jgi:2-C-methyl-D-erythritol 4-phosphate cytidylyltransferase
VSSPNLAVVFAGGVGSRMGGHFDALPKQFIAIGGKPILAHTLDIFQKHRRIDGIYLAVLAEYRKYARDMAEQYGFSKLKAVVEGGRIAQESIYNALIRAREENPPDSVALIHDGVRPVLDPGVIDANIESVLRHGTAITCTPCHETILLTEDGVRVSAVPFRRNAIAAQAPQSFRLAEIIAAHDEIRNSPTGYEDMVDACTIYHALGRPVRTVRGNDGNIKATTPKDIYALRAILQYRDDAHIFGLPDGV